jgi:hypothetical protein
MHGRLKALKELVGSNTTFHFTYKTAILSSGKVPDHLSGSDAFTLNSLTVNDILQDKYRPRKKDSDSPRRFSSSQLGRLLCYCIDVLED